MYNRCLKKMFAGLTCALYLVFGFTSYVSGAEFSLFTGNLNTTLQAAADNRPLPGGFPPARRWRQTELNPIISRTDILAAGDVLTLSLFAGTVYNSHIDRVSKNINGTITVQGRIDGFPLGYVIISTSGDNSLGTIHIPEKNEYYSIQSEPGNKTHYLLDVNAAQLDVIEDGPAPIPPPLTSQEFSVMDMRSSTLASNPLDMVTIDVMVVYTPAARVWAAGSGGGIINVIAQAVAQGQLVLDNSNTHVTLNLVYSGEINYTETGVTSTDLDRLTNPSDGYIDEVHSLRNQYNADMVGLFANINDVGGIGWELNNSSGRAAYAFSISRVQQASYSFTCIHEMGHNMGCGHNKSQLSEPGPGLFSYSAGWRWIGIDSGKYCSVMSYSSGSYYADGQTYTPVPYFSNPSIIYKGVSTGNAADGDNARTIRETKAVIAAYRAGTTTPAYIDIGLRFYDGSQMVKIACEQVTPSSPLRIRKNGTTYGIVLVQPDDSYASGIIIQTSSGPKAIRKYQ